MGNKDILSWLLSGLCGGWMIGNILKYAPKYPTTAGLSIGLVICVMIYWNRKI